MIHATDGTNVILQRHIRKMGLEKISKLADNCALKRPIIYFGCLLILILLWRPTEKWPHLVVKPSK
ncbi:hypothetical protein C0081_06625 [Cohaesibacter celericrescens]|uniref:Uncharacterized protein n=1 Tax=Cohaesibacter celericrescens TaxID=2067669 RepID=A0A2N5XTW3_9HYPH|nr:hypothetical protein C0081_06625 [Cohaesibacter celericrescens]